MNDAVKKESQPAGFTAAPPPPQVDGANAVDVSPAPAAAAAAATPHALGEGPNIAVPQDTAVKALQAVQVLVENNRSASQQLESLMAIVLDAAEVANRSASTVAATGNQLFKAADTLAKNNRSANIQAKLVLALTGTVLVGAAVAFSFMTMQLNEKVEQVDAMLLAVGKRAVDLKARLEAMDDINATLAELSLKQDNTQSVQMAIEDKLARVADQTRSFDPSKNNKAAPVAPTPAQPATKKTEGAKVESKPDSKPEVKAETKPETKADAKSETKAPVKTEVKTKAKSESEKKTADTTKPAANDQLNQQLSGLDALLTQQSKAVLELSQQLNSVKSAVGNVDSLKKDIENLSNLQKQRNQEAALAAVAAADARRDRELKERELKEREQKDREILKARDALREREIQREREAMREREVQREREAAQARAAATPVEAAPVAKEKPKSATFVKYSREQANTKTESQDNIPTYSKPAETKQQ
jgi:hypothetical protein